MQLEAITYRLCDKVCILAVGCIPVASVEYANRFFVDGWERLEEADEAAFIFELGQIVRIRLKSVGARGSYL